MNPDPIGEAAAAQSRLEDAIRERDVARAAVHQLELSARAQNEAFVQRARGWAERLREPAAAAAGATVSERLLHGLIREMLAYPGERATAERSAVRRLKELQKGAAQVAAAAAAGRRP